MIRIGRAVLVLAWTIIAVGSLFSVLRISIGGPAESESLGMDYRAFRAAGSLVSSGDGNLIYEPESEGFSELADVGFVYPPWFAIAMVPWTWVPFGAGLALWTLLGLAAFIGGLRAVGAHDPWVIAGGLVALPGAFAIALGQSSFFLVACVALALVPLGSGGRARGWLLGLASWKPHLLGGFALLAIGRPRTWLRPAVTAFATGLLLLGVAAVLLPGSVAAWIGFIGSSVDELASAILETSLPGGVALFAGSVEWWRYVVVATVGVVALGATVWALRRPYGGPWQRLALATAVWLLLMPHVVVYDLLLLVIPIGVLAGTPFRRDIAVFGTILAFGATIGPWASLAQLRAFDHAIDLATFALIVFALAAARWVVTGRPLFDAETPVGAPVEVARSVD